MSDPTPLRDSLRLPADLSGRQIGGFHLLRRLGKGAMAEVYLAEQPQLKRWVAVKILKPELAGDPAYVRRFEREARAAASLVHANIVQIHEVGHIDGLHYIVQEYVQGQNLREWLARNGPPLLQPALSIMRQIAAALAKAAEQGVVHRDVKPENIMITAAGEVKVADFGLARVLDETSTGATALTQVGITMGTPLYMSPEQVEGRTLDHRSDLYSFGVLCYHLLTGKPPFTGDTALAVAVQHVKTLPQPLEVQRPDLPPALCRVVHQMLAKDPEQRWQSCGEVLRELYRVQLQYCPQPTPEEAAAWSAIGMEPLSEPRMRASRQLAEAMRGTAQRRKTLSRWLVALGIVAMFAAGGVTAWCTTRPPDLTPKPSEEKVGVPHQDTELRQWFVASRIGTEEAWLSVIDYPGVSDLTQLRAKQQQARICLFRESDLDHALTVFNELLSMISKDEHKGRDKDKYAEFTAFALAGKGGILSLQKKYRESTEVWKQFWNYRDDLRDNKMNKLVQDAMNANRENLGPASGKEWDDWLKEHFKPAG
jgi:tRNA A-37 threonylcarbamoyl transferase component Bud32